MKNIFILFPCLLLYSLFAKSSAGNIEKLTNIPSPSEYIKVNLLAINEDGTISTQDGNMTIFDPAFSDMIDLNDFKKLTNFAENFSILRDYQNLAIERRQPVHQSDTIFYRMWQMRQKSYQLQFTAANMEQPGLAAYLEDSYLHTYTPVSLNSTTTFDFKVTADPASSNATRFRIVMMTVGMGALPVTITNFTANKQNDNMLLEWTAAGETNITEYVLEKSTNGKDFFPAHTVTGIQNKTGSTYRYTDRQPYAATSYYRVKSVYMNDKIEYSRVLRTNFSDNTAALTVFPNPVKGNIVYLQMNNLPIGNYVTKLSNSIGQVISIQQVHYTGGMMNTRIDAGNQSLKGTCHLEVFNANERLKNIEILLIKE